MSQNQKNFAQKMPLTLQWHVTNRCNWRCKHCYHDTYEGDELSLSEMKRVFDEFAGLLTDADEARINIMGGEAFIRPDTVDFCSYISTHKLPVPDFAITTNGSLLTPELLADLRQRAPGITIIKISIEGDEETNDDIRGKGAFQKILAAAARAKEHGFNVALTTTASKMNHDKILSLLDLLLIYDIPLFIRRFVPLGMGKKLDDVMLSTDELMALYKKVDELNSAYTLSNGARVLHMNSCTSGIKYAHWPEGRFKTCGVSSRRGMALMPNGDVYPCRLLPIKIGNVREQSLREIYDTGYTDFLDRETRKDKACRGCTHFTKCHGGAMCVSAAITGDYFAKDPQCPL